MTQQPGRLEGIELAPERHQRAMTGTVPEFEKLHDLRACAGKARAYRLR
jgi:hypothetical protein